MKLYAKLAGLVDARENCRKSNNTEWFDRHEETAEKLVYDYMPSGSGFDSGTKLDWDKSTGNKLVFNTSYHHMDQGGFYDGWTEHVVTVTPSLTSGFELRISGSNRNDIKEYMYQTFEYCLSQEV